MATLRGTLRRFLLVPWLLPVWAACLWVSWDRIPRGPFNDSTVGDYIDDALGVRGGMACYRFAGHDAVFALDDPDCGMMELGRSRGESDSALGHCFFTSRPISTGWWGITCRKDSWIVQAPHAAARSAFFDWLRTERGLADLPAEVRVRDVVRHTRLVSGYVHNAATVGVIVLVCTSLIGFGSRVRNRHGRRTARGLCPCCGYPTRGLPTPVCPECGERLEVTAPGSASKTQ